MLNTFLIILAFTFTLFILGALLSLAAKKFNVEPKDPMQHLVEDCLPQVQCGQCGYVGCAEYATAIITGEAPINLCTPGGDATVKAIADVMHMPIPTNNSLESQKEQIAYIDSSKCIGCTKCAKICPYDAIEGTIKQPHFVHPEFCTSCRKCINTCPTKCIDMVDIEETTDTWNWVLSKGEE
ncbi:MAG: RnfABCDGE type electron transport complex subunit B [Succinivibrionaceae bacterium]